MLGTVSQFPKSLCFWNHSQQHNSGSMWTGQQ